MSFLSLYRLLLSRLSRRQREGESLVVQKKKVEVLLVLRVRRIDGRELA